MKHLTFFLFGLLCLASCGSEEEEAPYVPQKPVNDGSVAVFQCPDEHHPHAIDLGLPSGTKWSCCNVDAATPEAFGNYFAWGETTPHKDLTFTWGTYTHYSYDERGHVTFNHLGADIAGTDYDVAHANWGGRWKMPTKAQVEELMKHGIRFATTHTDASGKEVKGIEIEGPKKSKIFIPCAGFYSDKGLNPVGGQFSIWTSTLNTDGDSSLKDRAIRFNGSAQKYEVGDYYRFYGLTVRPVAN